MNKDLFAHSRQGQIEKEAPLAQQAYERVRHELQGELAGLLSNGRLVIAYRSGHDIPFKRPDLVINAISAVVIAARR